MKYPYLIEYDKLINVLSSYIDTDNYHYREVNKRIFTKNNYDITITFNSLTDTTVVSQLSISSVVDFLEGYRIFRLSDRLVIEEYKSRDVIEYSEENVISSLVKNMIKFDPNIRNIIIDDILE